ncbi:3-oxoacyl-ACP synthase [Granulosicoccus antarcticus]|uniref:3-oxoacyl-[acyl-carrier-protein] synthase 2 n=1 Tax=Granulosicoccus antarcticus IMCC3135 TaxID=1192854 RepID=A0A2Z2NZT4_9GAMM|nr:3-oxoacyl-ACP synthase [Granulosicoccus antarcticus]ASJ76799.1 hypothetical protein IMCC3135_33790 [Granulosicoccus antarcticus IMCC3135]
MNTLITITGSGMVTAVGNDAASSCAAIHCAIDNFRESQFMDNAGEPITTAACELDEPCSGETRLVKMAAAALAECLASNSAIDCKHTPLILCLPERSRQDYPISDDAAFFLAIQEELGLGFSDKSRLLAHGHVSAAVALLNARQMLANNQSVKHVLIASADSLLSTATLQHFEDNDRLLTSEHSDGILPGEAAAAIVVERARGNRGAMLVHGIGFAVEPAPILSGKPTQAQGLTQAIKAALEEAQLPMQEMAYRITDLSGEHYYFREAALALSRTLRVLRDEFDILHPADCVGETGTALGFIILGYQLDLIRTHPPDFPQLIAHFSNDDGRRAAIVLGMN